MCSIKRYDLRETRRYNGICTTSSYAIELWEVGKFVKYLDYKKLDADNKRYREALDRIANDESCDEGAENIHDWPCMVAKAALDGDNNGA